MSLNVFVFTVVLAAFMSKQCFCEAASVQNGKFTFNFTSEYNYDCRQIAFSRMFLGSDDLRVHVTLSHTNDIQKVHSSAVLWVKAIRKKGFTVCTRETAVRSEGSSIVNWFALQGNYTGVEHGIQQFDELTTRTTCRNIKLSQVFTRVPRVFATTLLPDNSGRHDALNLWIENVTTSAFHACVREFTIFDNIHENVKVQWLAFESKPPKVWNSTVTGRVVFDENATSSKENGFALCKVVKFPDRMFAPPVVLTSVNHNSSVAGSTPPECNTVNTWIEGITHTYSKLCVKDLRGNERGDDLAVDYTVLGDLDPCINVSCDYFAVCKSFAPNDARCVCVEDCPSYEEQVCSSNATTFKNKCTYELEMCRLKSNHTLYHPGSCTGFPMQRGRFLLTQDHSNADTICETVPLFSHKFYPDAQVYVQATVNYWNTTEDDSIHNAVEAWVENVDVDEFTVCVTKAGRNDYPEEGFASVDWFSYQGAPGGAVADRTHIPQWWTGTTCKEIDLPKNKFQGSPTVLVTAEHMSRDLKHDAASLWLENITSTSFTVCLRELQNFDGLHADVQVSWLAFQETPRPFFAESSSVYFANDESLTEETNGAFCKDIKLSKRHNAPPTVIVSTSHSFSKGRIDPEYTGISSWVEYINTTGFRACLKQQHAKKYDPLTLSYAVLSGHCDDGWDYLSGVCFYTSPSCKTWTKSQESCRSDGGNLATIRNQEENVYAQYRHGGAKAWIGFNDKSFEGDFTWAGNDMKSNFTYWEKNQPNNLGDEDCVHTLGINHDFRWNDVACSDCHNYTCIADLNECLTDRHGCHSGAICSNNYGSYSCECDVGYLGDGRQCTDIDECSGSLPLCVANATCQNIAGSYKCNCNAGFAGDGRSNCTDVDECTVDAHACHSHAACNNSYGSYSCTCYKGYSGDGQQCADIDECKLESPPCDAHASCTNTDGAFMCHCKHGWTGDGFTCQDINECQTSPCHGKATCTNSPGSYACRCNIGWAGNGFSCQDVNECKRSPCHYRASCTNTAGSYSCRCDSGWTGNGFSCQVTDINMIPTKQETANKIHDHLLQKNLPPVLRKRSDVVYIIDDSGSVQLANFKKGLQALCLLIDRESASDQYGAVKFSSGAQTLFKFVSSVAAKHYLQNVAYSGGSTNTQAGLKKAREELFQDPTSGIRFGTRRVAVVITDGQSNVDRHQTIPQAQMLKNMGVQVFVIAVGQFQAGIQEIADIASSRENHLLRVASMGAFVDVVKLII